MDLFPDTEWADLPGVEVVSLALISADGLLPGGIKRQFISGVGVRVCPTQTSLTPESIDSRSGSA